MLHFSFLSHLQPAGLYVASLTLRVQISDALFVAVVQHRGKTGKTSSSLGLSTLRKAGIKLVFSPVLFFKLPAFLGIRNFEWCTEEK